MQRLDLYQFSDKNMKRARCQATLPPSSYPPPSLLQGRQVLDMGETTASSQGREFLGRVEMDVMEE